MKLSIIIPAYNESRTLPLLLDKVLRVPYEKEIIVVDDGSTDGTSEAIRVYEEREEIKVVRHERNMGKTLSIRTALGYIKGDITIIQDADLEYDPYDYGKLLAPILAGETDVVFGRRTGKHLYLSYYLGGKLVSILAAILYRQHLTDICCCYKAFDTCLLKSLPLSGCKWDVEAELTARIARQGIKIKEVPVSYSPRSFQEGKKIRWAAGLKLVYLLLKYRFIF